MRVFSFASLIILQVVAARSAQQPVQVYLFPTPILPSPHHPSPTLSGDQAKAVFTHHLGGSISQFDEIPNDEGIWGHMMSIWRNEKESQRARVVVIDGGVSPQGK